MFLLDTQNFKPSLIRIIKNIFLNNLLFLTVAINIKMSSTLRDFPGG